MKLNVTGSTASVEVSPEIFGCEYNDGLVHQVVTACLASARQGTKAQKTRAEVSGGGKKPWKQKGSGRARAGTIRGPLWRGGGVTFAAKPRNFSQKVNKKAYRKSIKIILSELLRQDRFLITNEINLPAAKTKELAGFLKGLDLNHVLIVSSNENNALYLAARNLPNVYVCGHAEIDPVNLLSFDKILCTVDALNKLQTSLLETRAQAKVN